MRAVQWFSALNALRIAGEQVSHSFSKHCAGHWALGLGSALAVSRD